MMMCHARERKHDFFLVIKILYHMGIFKFDYFINNGHTTPLTNAIANKTLTNFCMLEDSFEYFPSIFEAKTVTPTKLTAIGKIVIIP